MNKNLLRNLCVILVVCALLYSACAPTATPAPEQPPPAAPAGQSPGDCPNQRSSYILVPGRLVQVNTTVGDHLHVRVEPGFSSQELFAFADGDYAFLHEGPQERDCHLWWRVEDANDASRTGWAVESADDINTLVPVPLLFPQEGEVKVDGVPVESESTYVYPGNTIETGANGRAVVYWDDISHTQLFPQTVIEIGGADRDDSHSFSRPPGLAMPSFRHWFGHTFSQWVGETTTKISGELKKKMRVGLTREREVVADGTQFNIQVPQDDTVIVVSVTEGTVIAVTMVDGRRMEVPVEAGQHAALVENTPPLVVPLDQPLIPAANEPPPPPPPPGPQVLFDFVQAAPDAHWFTDFTRELPFGGDPSEAGYVNWRNDTLEDGRYVENALYTRPNNAAYGWINGQYSQTSDIIIQPGDYLSIEPGFVMDSSPGDVTVEVYYSPAGTCFYAEEFPRQLLTSQESNDGKVPEIRLGLDDLAGQSGCFMLRVFVGESLQKDWVMWASARLLRP